MYADPDAKMDAPTHESQILKPRDPAIEDDNAWPDFKLTNVVVFDQNTGDQCSLLVADEKRPLTVHGKLLKSKDRVPYLLHRSIADSLPTNISLFPVQTFSYGQNDEGEVMLWAAGAAGWFEIEPARTYRSFYRDDCEAVNVLYSVADFYRELKGKKVRSAAVEDVFRAYAGDPAHKCEDERRAEAVFQKHRRYLLERMGKGKEGVNWKSTSVYQYLQTEPEDEEMIPFEELRTPAHTPTEDPRSKHAGKGRSALRPRSSKHSQKGPGRQKSNSEEEDSTDSPIPNPPSRPSRPLQRKPLNGRAEGARKGQNGALHPSESDGTTSAPGVALPFNAKPPRPAGNAKRKRNPLLKIVSEPLPSYEPQGPGDVWTCNLDGCAHRVYDASLTEAKEMIREHYQKHAVDKQAQIDLVLKEERPYLPVGNLVNKIREMAARQQVKDAGGGNHGAGPTIAGIEQFYPKPIRQKY